MLDIIKQEKNTITYKCHDCNAGVKCFIKQPKTNIVIVLDITCPNCNNSERVTLLQYDSEIDKKSLLDNLNTIDFSWVPTINEEIDYVECGGQ